MPRDKPAVPIHFRQQAVDYKDMFTKSCSVVMPYIPSRWGQEIKYALRSLCRFYPAIKNLVIIADKIPDLLNPDKIDFIQSNSSVDSEFKRLASISEFVTEEFIWFNDDYFILNSFSADDLSQRYLEKVEEKHITLAKSVTEPWQKTVWHAVNILKEKKLPFENYALHCPTLFSKEEILQTLNHFSQFFPPAAGRFEAPHFETLHFNWHYSQKAISPYWQEERRIQFFANSKESFLEKCSSYKFMFYDDTCPGLFLSSFLDSREPDPCYFEKNAA